MHDNTKADSIISKEIAGDVVNYTEQLKPCPFCQNKPRFISCGLKYDIACMIEGCYLEYGGGYFVEDRDDLAEIWNNREDAK